MYKIKRGDKVIVLVGKDKGKKGTVLRIVKLGKEKIKAVVEGINMVKKHKKADPSKNYSGGIVEKEMPMDISNVALLNPKTDKADKVGFKFVEQKKVRYFKSNQEVVVDA